MSIYATLWKLKFPRHGDLHLGSEWIEVTAQGVPPHIGSPTPGCGYEDGDLYAAFLPPPLVTDEMGAAEHLRAVVFVTADTAKGTARSPQEYVDPLLVLSGEEYARITFDEFHERICDGAARRRVTQGAQDFVANSTGGRYMEDHACISDLSRSRLLAHLLPHDVPDLGRMFGRDLEQHACRSAGSPAPLLPVA